MDEHPARALRARRTRSIVVATELVRRRASGRRRHRRPHRRRDGRGQLLLGTLPGIERPALAVQMVPTAAPFVLLDIGANPDSTAENLAQFARMGAIFARARARRGRPRVALLSIGEEKGKGDARIQRATELLDETDLNFMGNVEGKDLTRQMADVVVCDAVLGNVVIKFFEGLSGFIFDLFRAEFSGSIRGRLAYLLHAAEHRPDPRRVRLRDRRRVAAAGRPGTVIITHGRARRRMIEHAVRGRRRRRRGSGCRSGSARRCAEDARGRRGRRAAASPAATARPIDLGRPMTVSGPVLSVGPGVIRETVRLAALEVPGVLRVGRGGPRWRDVLGGSPIRVRIRDGRVDVTVRLVARPRQPLVPLTAQVRAAVGAAVERLLGMELGAVTVLVDGVGG